MYIEIFGQPANNCVEQQKLGLNIFDKTLQVLLKHYIINCLKQQLNKLYYLNLLQFIIYKNNLISAME